MISLHHGDCLEILNNLAENSIDAIVTDPPYGLNFMGKKWDYDVPSVAIWQACLRVLKPGGHLLAFAGTRTQHRMTVNIEDAGFQIRDMIAWLYGSGFPKSLNVGKAIDKAAGVEREVIGPNKFAHLNGKENKTCYGKAGRPEQTASVTQDAKKWDGWGTALKPAIEPITLARKPLSEKTVAANVLIWDTGAINIDECRVKSNDNTGRDIYQTQSWKNTSKKGVGSVSDDWKKGRWPANVIHDGSEEVVENFPQTTKSTAARFFYCAKASKSERNLGCEQIEAKHASHDGRDKHIENPYQRHDNVQHNNHPTVKPIKLMKYLVALVTPPGGTVLDPFMGSGSTGIACKNKDYCFIGIEKVSEYYQIAHQRITNT